MICFGIGRYTLPRSDGLKEGWRLIQFIVNFFWESPAASVPFRYVWMDGMECRSAGRARKLKADERSECSLKETAAVPIFSPLPPADG